MRGAEGVPSENLSFNAGIEKRSRRHALKGWTSKIGGNEVALAGENERQSTMMKILRQPTPEPACRGGARRSPSAWPTRPARQQRHQQEMKARQLDVGPTSSSGAAGEGGSSAGGRSDHARRRLLERWGEIPRRSSFAPLTEQQQMARRQALRSTARTHHGREDPEPTLSETERL